LAVEECAFCTIGNKTLLTGLSQLDCNPLQHPLHVAVVLNDSISVAESAAHGPYRQTSTPIIIPMIDMQDRQRRDLQLQHDLFGFVSLLLALFFLDDFVWGGSSLSYVAAAAAAFLLLFLLLANDGFLKDELFFLLCPALPLLVTLRAGSGDDGGTTAAALLLFLLPANDGFLKLNLDDDGDDDKVLLLLFFAGVLTAVFVSDLVGLAATSTSPLSVLDVRKLKEDFFCGESGSLFFRKFFMILLFCNVMIKCLFMSLLSNTLQCDILSDLSE